MLGVLSAIGAALRPLGAGTAGIETSFFLLIVAGRVFGPGFGFVLGSTTLFASALLTGGVGPWLPFQMLAASWVGLGAGLLPPMRGRREIAMLAVYAAVRRDGVRPAHEPVVLAVRRWATTPPSRTCRARRSLENLHRLLLYSLATSMGWDVVRAITNVVLILLAGSRRPRRPATDRAACGLRPWPVDPAPRAPRRRRRSAAAR